MSAIQSFTAATRQATGTRAVRSLRKGGQVPINISRKGAASTSLQMDARSAEIFDAKVVHLAKLEVDGKAITVLRGAIARDVLTDKVTHIDLLEVSEASEIKVQVAVVANTLNCPGIKSGGIVNQNLRSVEVLCRADSIPDVIEVDLSNTNIMESVYVDSLVPPAGVKVLTPGRQVILTIAVSRGMATTTTDATAAAGTDAAAAPAAAAGDAKPAEAAKK